MAYSKCIIEAILGIFMNTYYIFKYLSKIYKCSLTTV